MRKQIITRVFLGSILACVTGLVLLIVAGSVLYRSGTFIMSGPDVVGIKSSGLGWAMLGLGLNGMLVIAAGVIAELVAWIGAVLNTAMLPDKTWMAVLLLTGLLSFGFLATITYVLAGPDGLHPQTDATTGHSPAPTSREAA